MIRKTVWIWVWALLSGSGFGAVSRAPVGMVLQTTGKTVLHRDGRERVAQLADLLYPGDRLTPVQGEVTFLFCPSSQRFQASSGADLSLAETSVTSRGGSEPAVTTIRRCSLPRVALGNESIERSGAVRLRDSGLPEVVLYLGGPVWNPRPRFSWAPVAAADHYRIRVESLQGESLWEETTSEVSALYAPTRPQLEPGTYQWTVEAIASGRPVARGSVRFQQRPGSGGSRPGPGGLQEALVLEGDGFFAEAALLIRPLAEAGAGNDRLKRHLVWLYRQAGLEAAAEAEKKGLDSKGR